MENIKLIAVGRAIEISKFNQLRAFRYLDDYRTYSSMFESGHYHRGVWYPCGKQPYRLLSLIVKDRPK